MHLIAIALRWFLDPNDLKLVTAVFIFAVLVLFKWFGSFGRRIFGGRLREAPAVRGVVENVRASTAAGAPAHNTAPKRTGAPSERRELWSPGSFTRSLPMMFPVTIRWPICSLMTTVARRCVENPDRSSSCRQHQRRKRKRDP